MDLTALMVVNPVTGMLINPVPILFLNLNLRVNLNCFSYLKCQRFQAIIKISYFPDTNRQQKKKNVCEEIERRRLLLSFSVSLLILSLVILLNIRYSFNLKVMKVKI